MAGAAEMSLPGILERADMDATLAVNSLNSPVSDFIWQIFSDKEIWYVMYLVVAFFIFRNLGWKKGLVVFVSIILTVLCGDQLANLTKDMFQRLRPCMNGDMVAGGLHVLEGYSVKHCYGFYSAHAADALGFALCSSLGFTNDKSRNYGIYTKAVTVWALLVGISRVFVGKHFLGDVLVGFIVGALFALLFGKAASTIIRKKLS